jgi:hypothetical protein
MARPEMQALEIARAETATPDAPVAGRAPAPAVERSIVPVPGPGSAQPSAGDAGPAPSAEPGSPGLRAGPRDPRLWVAPRDLPQPPALTEHERYMLHLRARLDAVNDSMGMGQPNTDWTTTDGQGRRWGLSPAGVHLGGVTIPAQAIPLPTRSSEDEYADLERRRQREEIIRDEGARERQRIRDERERVPRRDSGGG